MLQLVYQSGGAGSIVRLGIFGSNGTCYGYGLVLCLSGLFVVPIRGVDVVQGALSDIYGANGDDKKAGEAKARAVAIAGTIATKYPQSDYAARAASLVYQLQESIPIYGTDRQ